MTKKLTKKEKIKEEKRQAILQEKRETTIIFPFLSYQEYLLIRETEDGHKQNIIKNLFETKVNRLICEYSYSYCFSPKKAKNKDIHPELVLDFYFGSGTSSWFDLNTYVLATRKKRTRKLRICSNPDIGVIEGVQSLWLLDSKSELSL